MEITSFMGPLVSLSGDRKASESTPLGGRRSLPSQQLPFTMERQIQTNWCWAATSSSVSAYFDNGSSWSQCNVADATLSRRDCCGDGANGACNVPYYLDDALTSTGNFDRFSNGTEPFGVVTNEIGSGRPLCIRVGWRNGGGHFLCIIGCGQAASGAQYFHLADPIYGTSQVPTSTLDGSYQSSGTWSHTYFVRSAAGGGAEMVAAAAKPPGTMGA
jgi:Papain-like cysteine protease AvrRpt2